MRKRCNKPVRQGLAPARYAISAYFLIRLHCFGTPVPKLFLTVLPPFYFYLLPFNLSRYIPNSSRLRVIRMISVRLMIPRS